MTHLKITIGRQPSKTTQTIFAVNLASLLKRHGASVTVQQETGAVHGGTKLDAMLPENARVDNSEVLIFLEGQ